MDTLDKIIEIATKVAAALNVIAPGTGSIADAGLNIAKYLIGLFNNSNPDNPIALPPDDELINRLEETSTRVVDDSERYLHESDSPVSESQRKRLDRQKNR